MTKTIKFKLDKYSAAAISLKMYKEYVIERRGLIPFEDWLEEILKSKNEQDFKIEKKLI